MGGSLERLFSAINAPRGPRVDQTSYAVATLPDCKGFFVGKDPAGRACFLIATAGASGNAEAPIRLARLEAAFDLPCELMKPDGVVQRGRFTVLRCLSRSMDVKRYFLSMCAALARAIGNRPTASDVALAVHRVASMFRAMHRPASHVVNGLFGELYTIARSGEPTRMLRAWRVDETARYDFVDGELRVEVKTTATRTRSHVFTYEQCNPPTGTIAVVVSMMLERVFSGWRLP